MNNIFIADTHCGHRTGLTPPKWWLPDDDGFIGKVARFQRELWSWFCSEIDSCGPVDTCIHVGDVIDGKGFRSGGTELLTPDRAVQIQMAEIVFEEIGAKNNLIINGTPYHTGNEEDWEAAQAL